MSAHSGAWFNVLGGDVVALRLNPGRVIELVGRRFRLVRPWRPGAIDDEGVALRNCWPVGGEGKVSGLRFFENQWIAELSQFEDNGELLNGRWTLVLVQEFLRLTEPLEPPKPNPWDREAANDG